MRSDKDVCSLAGVGSYQDRIGEAIRRAGGKSQLAKRVRDRSGKGFTVQSVQYLARTVKPPGKKGPWKPATGSRHDAHIAAAVGLRAEWLASGKGPMDDGEARPAAEHPAADDELVHSIARRAHELGYTAQDFAEALGITASDAAELIKGNKVPTDASSLRKLATLLNLPLSQLADPYSGGPLAAMSTTMLMRLTADEIEMIGIYRDLQPFGKKALRRRALELQREFLPTRKVGRSFSEDTNAND